MNEMPGSENLKVVHADEFHKPILSIRTVLILFIILLLIFAPITIERLNIRKIYAEKLLSNADEWPIILRDFYGNASPSQFAYWKPTDGTTADSVNLSLLTNGRFEISVAPTQNTIVREAFFNEHAFAPRNFLLTAGVSLPDACDTGLIFRGDTLGEYYSFLVGNDHYTVEDFPRNPEGDLPRQAIIPNKPIPESIGRPSALGVLANDNHYYFYINHDFVDSMSDSRLHGERTGIEILVCQNIPTESIFQYDNFTVRTPNK